MKRSRFYTWYLVVLSAFIGSLYAAAFPQFSLTLDPLSNLSGIGVEVLLISDSVKSLFIVLGMLFSGAFYRVFGLKPTFILSTLAFLVPQLLIPSVHNVPALFALKALQGLSSMMYSLFLSLILKYASPEETGLSSALFNGIFFGASGIITGITGIIIERLDWIASYHALSVLLGALSLLWFFTVRDETAEPSVAGPTDGSFTVILGSSRTWLLAVCLISTVWTNQALLVDGPLYLKYLNFSARATGRLMSITTVGILLACLLSGRISDFAAARSSDPAAARMKVLMMGPLVIIVSVAALLGWRTSGEAGLMVILLAVSFGSAWGYGSFYCVLPEYYKAGEVPLVTGLAGGAADVAMPLAPLVVGVVFGVRGLWFLGWSSCLFMAGLSLISGGILLKRQHLKKTLTLKIIKG